MVTFRKLSLAVVSVAALSACNSPNNNTPFIKSGDVFITTANNDTIVNLSADVNLGPNIALAEFGAKVLDPQTKVERGAVDFSQLPAGVGRITLGVNVSLFTAFSPGLGDTLPNGKPLPLVLGAQPGDVTGIPIGADGHSRVYVGGDIQKTAFIGAALCIPGLDQVMNQLDVPVNLFFMGNINPHVMLVGGIYGSNVQYENGLAVFGKYIANPPPPALAGMKIQSDLTPAVDPQMDNEIAQMNWVSAHRLMKFLNGKKVHHLHIE